MWQRRGPLAPASLSIWVENFARSSLSGLSSPFTALSSAAAALMPKIALRGAQGLKAIRLEGKNLTVDIGLLRLIGSAANSAVAAFTKLAQATVPKMIRK